MTTAAGLLLEAIRPSGFYDGLFIKNFEVICNQPSGVENVRTLILDLAVRGRLVPPDPSAVPVTLNSQTPPVVRSRRASTAPLPPLVDTERPFNLPGTWRWGRVDNTGDYINGLAFKPSDWGTAGLPIIRIQNLTDRARPFNRTRRSCDEQFIVRDGDLLLSWSATLDVFVWSGEDAVLNQHIFRVIPNDTVVDKRFLFHALRERIAALAESDHAHGLVMKHINRGPFLAFPFPFPPLTEQKHIAAKVDQLMILCEQLEARLTKKHEIAVRLTASALQALASARVGGELTVAWARVADNMDAVVPDLQAVAALRGAILDMAVCGRLVPSEGGKEAKLAEPDEDDHYDPTFSIPRHWTWASLAKVCRFIDYRGRTPTKTKSGVRLITAKNVRPGYIRDEPVEFIGEADYGPWMTRGLPAFGDVLFTTEAPLGNVAQLLTHDRVALAQRVITLHPVVGLDPAYLKTALMSPLMQKAIIERATGTTAQGIKASRLKRIPLPLPPKPEQKRIVAKAEELLAMCDGLEKRLRESGASAAQFARAVVEQMVTEERSVESDGRSTREY